MRFPCHDPGLAPVIRRVGFVGLGHVGAKLAGPLGTASVLKVVTNYLVARN